MFTREQVKANAVSNLNRIGCYKPYTEAFRNGTLTMYENCGGYYVEDEALLAKIHTIEEEYSGIPDQRAESGRKGTDYYP